jgi:hypothetical protein
MARWIQLEKQTRTRNDSTTSLVYEKSGIETPSTRGQWSNSCANCGKRRRRETFGPVPNYRAINLIGSVAVQSALDSWRRRRKRLELPIREGSGDSRLPAGMARMLWREESRVLREVIQNDLAVSFLATNGVFPVGR